MSRYKAYPEYKESGVIGLDRLPFDWSVKKVKHIFNIGRGRVISQEELIDDGEFPVYSSQTANDGCLGFISTFDFDCDQLTWTTDGANAGTIFLRGGKHNCTNVCGTLQPIKSTVLLKFFSYSLQYVAQFYKRPDTNGAKIMNGEMAEILVSFPSDIEQQKIANFLDHETAKIDTLIAKQQELIKLLKEKRQAVISHAVTKGLNPNAPMRDSGVEWLGEIPAHWERIKLKHVIREIIDAEHKTAEYIDDGSYLVCRTTNVRDGVLKLDGGKYTNEETYFEWIKRGLPEPGDILFTREAPAGEACIVPQEPKLCLGQRMVLFKLKRDTVHPKYLLFSIYAGLADDFIKQLSQGSTVSHMNMADIVNIPLLRLPVQEQAEIVEYLEAILDRYDGLQQNAERAIELMQERRTALISAAVTGKIDVRDWQAPVSETQAA